MLEESATSQFYLPPLPPLTPNHPMHFLSFPHAYPAKNQKRRYPCPPLPYPRLCASCLSPLPQIGSIGQGTPFVFSPLPPISVPTIYPTGVFILSCHSNQQGRAVRRKGRKMSNVCMLQCLDPSPAKEEGGPTRRVVGIYHTSPRCMYGLVVRCSGRR